MNPHMPTEDDFRRIQELLNAKIRTGEQVRSEINNMIAEATKRGLVPVGERLSAAESGLATARDAARKLHATVDSSVDQIVDLQKQLKGCDGVIHAQETKLTEVRASIHVLQTNLAAVDQRLIAQASELDLHTSALAEIRTAFRGADNLIAEIKSRLDDIPGRLEEQIFASESRAATAIQALTSKVDEIRNDSAVALAREIGGVVEKITDQAARTIEVNTEAHARADTLSAEIVAVETRIRERVHVETEKSVTRSRELADLVAGVEQRMEDRTTKAEMHLLEELEVLKQSTSGDVARLVGALEQWLSNIKDQQNDSDKKHELARVEAEKRQASTMMEHAKVIRRSAMQRDAAVLVLAIAALVLATIAWLQ